MQTAPGAADALSLAKYRLASRWQPLMHFWLYVLTIAVALVFVLEVLGPPERIAGADPATEAPLPDQARPAPPIALVGKPAEAPRLPAALMPTRPDPAPPPPPIPSVQPLADAAPPDAPRARVIVHPARAEGGDAIANRLAARSDLSPDQVDVGTVGEARPDAVIRFYATGDHPLARRLGKELARMGYSWRIENFAERPSTAKDQAVEVFLPDK